MEWLAELLEVGMVLSFFAAWPASIMKSYRSRTAKGKSLAFLLIIEFGYLCIIASKIIGNNVTYVLVFYCMNLCTVGIDVALYFRNRKLDMLAAEEKAA